MKDEKRVKEIIKTFKEEAKKKGKNLSWFKYAVKNKPGGWKFLSGKEEQWNLLEEISERVNQKHKEYKSGQIVDMISQLVNR
ncbi:hypothetical protein A2774_02520 [Candidatus Roizmanbacteria bacterium RIFCSPHIGHO2_01_FULL_39_12c]|uniref:Uncharacterized protein n=1 Tax=Candidatus Roizmanbacteria bacterium RIFCSPHIGHO2_01_FULL_39_12c TaxID=1802031 RepID=A0A1F7G937_9BACT|nr:MAG: hypothetical protein A2774_02520 [Candidatus Roizmanbacteria bacterium RIFCSPHIGHO2_01_FULL_39_12c]OGK47711.1 MAG: hypothetical protein A2963_00440 [Candidatus Roizmanbacteria bacterium RIFCSPLOWO2_01_FULL_40_13]